MILLHVEGRQVTFGGEAHEGWLPDRAAVPPPTPLREAILDVRIEHNGDGYLLKCDSRNTPDSWDTWHETLEAAQQAAREWLGIEPCEWIPQ